MKPDTKGHVECAAAYIKCPGRRIHRQKSRMLAERGRGGGPGPRWEGGLRMQRVTAHRHRVFGGSNEMFHHAIAVLH